MTHSSKLLYGILISTFVAFPSLAARHKKPVREKRLTPAEIVKRADEARCPQGSLSFTVRVTDSEGASESKETVYRVSSRDSNNSLVETKEPERLKGRKLLMQGEDLWIYLPDLKRPTRIGFEQRLTGEVSNGDLARTNYGQDYSARLMGLDTVDGKKCYRLMLTAKRKTLPYRRIVYWVEKDTFFPVKVKFFALSGKLLKTGVYSDPQPILNKTRVTKFMIQDATHANHQSTLVYSDFKVDKFDESFFSKESLGD